MFAIALSCLVLASTVFSKCPDPISLPVKDVTLSDGSTMRGIPVSLGTPPQPMSFMPQAFLNNTWVYNNTLPICFPDTSQFQCLTYRGGLYNEVGSTTDTSASGVDYAAGVASDLQCSWVTTYGSFWTGSWTTDVLSLAGRSFKNFPIGMFGNTYFASNFDTQSQIGMGSSSAILKLLKDAGHIVSNSYSWWWGKDSTSGPGGMDGSIVFGGYDRAKTSGKRYTQSLVPPSEECISGMLVAASDLILNYVDGTTVGLLNGMQMSFCLKPDWPALMTIWDTVSVRFNDLTDTHNLTLGTTNGRGQGYLYDPGNVFAGSLTIKLDNGLSINVPNEDFVTPYITTNYDGSENINTTVSQVQMYPLPGNESTIFLLGRLFFSSAYLSVDHDEGTFSLWEAKATTETDLVSFGKNCPDDSRGGTTPKGSTADNNNNNDNEHEHSNGLSGGEIAGIVVGGVAGVAAIIAVGALLYKQRRKRSTARYETARTSGGQQHSPEMMYRSAYQQPMSREGLQSGGRQGPTELDANGNWAQPSATTLVSVNKRGTL